MFEAARAPAAEMGDGAMYLQLSGKQVRAGAAISFLTLAASVFAADPQVDPVELLQQIRNKVATRLSQLPNYTCTETIDRLLRRPSTGLQQADRVQLEVAFVGNRELYAKPGGEFQEGHAGRLITTGTISDGEYGSHMVSLFRTDKAEFEYAGMCKKDGHRTYRFDFRMAQDKSNFLLKHDASEGIVGYKGSFWADTSTLDLVRLEIKAEHIPSYIGIDSVSESIRYEMIETAGSQFLLPHSSELAVWFNGVYSLNSVKLENCREYTGESTVAFGSVESTGSAARSAEDPAKKAADPKQPEEK